ncbi:MAG: GcrA family cell cycle regulator [Pseudomonadota bacterium]
MSWNDERVDLLKKLWAEGHSASHIAKELGDVTRNAVIGKVHRLGLSNRNGAGGGESAKAKSAAKPKAAKSASKKSKAPETEPKQAEKAAPVSRTKAIIPATQPLPPQPSANEIDPEALKKYSEIEKKALRLSLMELTERTCKWPIGDPATDDFWFCGLPVAPGKPYCEPCVGVAYQPASARRDRKRQS